MTSTNLHQCVSDKIRRFGTLGGASAMILFCGVAQGATVNASCTASRGNFANATTHYHEANATTIIDKFSWTLGGKSGGKSNVALQQKINERRSGDPVIYSYTSPDNVKSGADSHTPDRRVSVPLEKRTYTNYKFVFDRTGPDPKCTARTTPDI